MRICRLATSIVKNLFVRPPDLRSTLVRSTRQEQRHSQQSRLVKFLGRHQDGPDSRTYYQEWGSETALYPSHLTSCTHAPMDPYAPCRAGPSLETLAGAPCPPSHDKASALYPTGTPTVKFLQDKLLRHLVLDYVYRHRRARHELKGQAELPRREMEQFVGEVQPGSAGGVEN